MLTEPNQRATIVKKPGQYKNQCRLLKKQREQTENIHNNPGNKSSDANTSNSNGNVNNLNNNDNRNSNRAERKPKTVYPPCETSGKTNHSTERCYHGTNAANRPPPRQRIPERQNQVQERAVQNDSNKNNRRSPKFELNTPRFHSGVAIDRPEITHLTLPPIPEVFWQ